MSNPTVALWVVNIGHPVPGIVAWLDMVESRLAEAKEGGADLLMLPEYACAQWLGWVCAGVTSDREIAFIAGEAAGIIEPLEAMVGRYGVALLAGTVPVAAGGALPVNRAHLILPEAGGVRTVVQDKLCLTPSERDPAGWCLAPGHEIRVTEWRGLRLAVVICLDIELPALAAAIADERIDLLLVPSMTSKPSGYHRVFGCAKARAIELQTIVCAVGTIGSIGAHTSYSGAAVYVPCEEALGYDGRFAELSPQSAAGPEDDPRGPMLIARDLPIDTVRRLRDGAAEVWPGAWPADGLRIERV